jgi:o-succinylbenzoate---CoA ligase
VRVVNLHLILVPMSNDPLADRARRSPEGLALVDRGGGAARPVRLTWGALDAMAGAWADRLSSAGVRPGERVAVVEPAGASFAALLHACIRIGAVMVPLPPRAQEAERARLIEQARPRAVIAGGEVDLRGNGLRAEGDLCLLHTSGTMGPPKQVRLTLENHRASARGCIESLGRRRNDVWLLMLSPHHVGGFAIFMRSVLYGHPVVSLPGFDADAAIAAIEEERPTLVSAVPSMLTRILDAGGAAALRGPRAILVGGAPAGDDQVAAWADMGLMACPTYGMTETCSQIATVPPGRARELLGTSGFVHSQAAVTIEEGVIAVSGPVVSPTFGGRVLTGDLGHLDERGALVVAGRKDDVIITGGEKVHPAEVENTLRLHPAVREAAVVGRPDRVYGLVLEALVVAEGVTAEELVAWCRERLPGFKIPRRVRFVERLPLSEGGKLLRTQL